MILTKPKLGDICQQEHNDVCLITRDWRMDNDPLGQLKKKFCTYECIYHKELMKKVNRNKKTKTKSINK